MDFDLQRFHSGDEALFAELVRRYSPRLLPQLRRFAGPLADANDLLQEVWLRAYQKRRSFEGRGSLLGWLLAVAQNVGLTAIRSAPRETALAQLPEVTVEPDTRSGLIRDALQNAVLALPPRQRDVLILRLVEGFSTAETARALQCAEGTVKALLHQATCKLRKQLKELVP